VIELNILFSNYKIFRSNSYHHRSSPTHRTAHWTPTGLPWLTLYCSAFFCFIFRYLLLYLRCVEQNWLSARFWSHGNKNSHSFILQSLTSDGNERFFKISSNLDTDNTKKIIVFIKLCTYAALVVVYTVYYKPIHLTAAEKKTSQVDFYNRLTSIPIYPFLYT